MPHKWTAGDEAALMDTIERHAHRRERLKDAGYGADAWWAEIAALLLDHGVDTTGGGASRRAYEIRCRQEESGDPDDQLPDDSWERVTDQVLGWERDWFEGAQETLMDVRDMLAEALPLLRALAAIWEVEA